MLIIIKVLFLFIYDNELIANPFLLFTYLGKGRLHNFNYGLYWPLWDLICGTRYHDDHSNSSDVSHSSEIKEHIEKKCT